MKTYDVLWCKRYYSSGTVKIEANSVEEAEELALDEIGNYTGSMQYDPDGDETEVMEMD